MNAAPRILVRLPNWLGDVVLARPLLHALRRAQPSAEVCGVAPRPLLELLEQDGVLDRLEPWPTTPHGREALLERLRAWRPGAAVILPPSFSSAWWSWRTGAQIRVGYRHQGRGPLLTRGLSRPARGEMHLSEEYLALGRTFGARPGAVPPLAISQPAQRAAAERLAENGVGAARYAVLGPGASYGPAKRWAAGRYAALGRVLAARDLCVLVCGAAGEVETCLEVGAGIGPGATVLAGRTSLLEQAAILRRAAVAVCNDSGLAHLSAAVGAPTVVIFGSTSSAWTAPLGERVRVVQRPPVCSPCFRRTCRIGYRCLEAVPAAEVERACLSLVA